MNKIDVYKGILRDTIQDEMQLEDILLRGLVLHTHSIALRPGVDLDDVSRDAVEERVVLAPLTRTHVAELLALLWPQHEVRGRQDLWFTQYGRLTPFELFEDVRDDLRERASAARNSVAGHSLVDELIAE